MSETRPLVAVLDYGIGNLHSAQKALEKMGADARLTTDPAVVAAADGAVLPGVGAFGACMRSLREAGLEQPALDAVASGRPFLGICVGMQMLFDGSEENADVAGLGVIPGTIRWIPPTVSRPADRRLATDSNGGHERKEKERSDISARVLKRPQMQWNRLVIRRDDPMFADLGDDPWVYFVHSLHGVPTDDDAVVATCEYGGTLNAVFRLDNVFATQFHPEKSGPVGLRLLRNFVRVCAEARAGRGAA